VLAAAGEPMTSMPLALSDSGAAVATLGLLHGTSAPGHRASSEVADETVVAIGSATDVVTAREQGRTLAARLGFSASDQMMIVTAISELARNILDVATLGQIAITPTRTGSRLGLVVEARDQGPGIADPDRVMEGGHSSGFGLPGVRRLMDEFEIASELGKGTTVMATKWQFVSGGGLGSVPGATILEVPGDTLCPTAP
jgi:serine/threonine-protein kinase RsbT